MVIIERPELCPMEQGVFDALAEEKGLVVSFDALARRVYGFSDAGTRRAMRVHVYRIRKKLGEESVISVWGVGYRCGWS